MEIHNHHRLTRLMFILIVSFHIVLATSQQPPDLYYPGFKLAGANISLTGIAQVLSSGALKLTNDSSRLLGHAFYSSPFQFKSSDSPNATVSSFSTSFVFVMVPEYHNLGGHGLAFAISASKDFAAMPSQYLGLLNGTNSTSNHLFAVEFDTVQDFAFGDINNHHVGVDVNSLVSTASTAAGYYAADDLTKVDLNLNSGKPIFVWIDYDSATTTIDVTISPSPPKPTKPILSVHLDLSPVLRRYMYIGFSASTGLLASSHYILGWSFRIGEGEAKSLDLSALPSLQQSKKHRPALTVALSVASAVIFIIAAISAAIFVTKKIKNRDVVEDWELDIGPHRFSYQELKKATGGFTDKEVLGSGGFGKVYKGSLTLTQSQSQSQSQTQAQNSNSKTLIAVKRISNESKQGFREFVSEIATIGRLRHRNLVQLLGWCRRRGDLLLVYEFMENGSLDRFIYDEPGWGSTLTWAQRFHIVKGVASGLVYLHEGFGQVVIHRDIKASNVLLDREWNGRLGDFGLARFYDHGSNSNTTKIVGTFGYLAPELPRTGQSSTGSDVFAFGAFLLEVVCGRRPVEADAKPEELVLVDWVWEKYRQGRVLEVVDTKLKGEFNEVEILMVLRVGLMCSNNKAEWRPTMRQVVMFLDGEMDVPENVRAPGGFEANQDRLNFEDFLNSYVSSSSFGGSGRA